MIVTVFVRGWPSFAHNGLAWFGAGGNVEEQLNEIFLSGQPSGQYVYTFHAWPLIWSTILITGGAVTDRPLLPRSSSRSSSSSSRPKWMSNILQPVVRFLASVPSVIYGLLGVLVLVPFIGNHLVTEPQKASVAGVISLTGYSLMAAVLILTVMIAPLMVSIFSDGLRAVRPGWLEGSLALGRQPLADDLEDRGPHGAAGDRRRHRAGGRARDRRGGDAGDGLRLGRLRAQPRRRPDLHL